MSPRSRRRFPTIIPIVLILLPATYLSMVAAQPMPTVLINEFMPNTGSDLQPAEWVELFNPGPSPSSTSRAGVSMMRLSGAPISIGPGTFIPANGLLVLLLSPNILNNSGSDAIELFDEHGQLSRSPRLQRHSSWQKLCTSARRRCELASGRHSWLSIRAYPGSLEHRRATNGTSDLYANIRNRHPTPTPTVTNTPNRHAHAHPDTNAD